MRPLRQAGLVVDQANSSLVKLELFGLWGGFLLEALCYCC